MTPRFKIIAAYKRPQSVSRVGSQLGMVEVFFPASRITMRGIRIVKRGKDVKAAVQSARGIDGLPLVQLDSALLHKIALAGAEALIDAPEFIDPNDEPVETPEKPGRIFAVFPGCEPLRH